MSETDVTWDALPPEQEAAFQQMWKQMQALEMGMVPEPSEDYRMPEGILRPDLVYQRRETFPRAEVAPTCATCRWHLVDPDDGHQPRWGVCLRVAGSPPAPMAAVAADGSGAMLRTSPAFSCRAWEA